MTDNGKEEKEKATEKEKVSEKKKDSGEKKECKEESCKQAARKAIWIRGLYMLLFAFLYGVAKAVMVAVVLFQFVFSLISVSPNEQLLRFGKKLSLYMYQILLFLTFNEENHPFPIGPWPEDDSV